MKVFKTLLLALCVLPGVALAGEAHVCKSDSLPMASANAALSESKVFKCGDGVTGSIPQLAKAGWQIVQVLEQSDAASLAASMQPGKPPANPEDLTKTYWQLVIQK